MNMTAFKPPRDFRGARVAYLNGEGSLRELSARFGIPRRTLERRAAREGWRRVAVTAGAEVAALAAGLAADRRDVAASAAARFMARAAESADYVLARVLAALDAGEYDPAGLRQLVAGWRDATLTGRSLHGLDPTPGVAVNIGILAGAFQSGDIADAAPLIEAEREDPEPGV